MLPSPKCLFAKSHLVEAFRDGKNNDHESRTNNHITSHY